MFKCFKNMVCILVIAWRGFVSLAAWSGGGKIRELGAKAEGLMQKGVYKLADKADSIKESVGGIAEKVKKWSGKREGGAEKSLENVKELKKEGILKK